MRLSVILVRDALGVQMQATHLGRQKRYASKGNYG